MQGRSRAGHLGGHCALDGGPVDRVAREGRGTWQLQGASFDRSTLGMADRKRRFVPLQGLLACQEPGMPWLAWLPQGWPGMASMAARVVAWRGPSSGGQVP